MPLCYLPMRLPILTHRPLGARLRATSFRPLSPSARLSRTTRCQHHGLVGNEETDDDDDEYEAGDVMEEDRELDFQENYFPVKLGQIFDGRYQIVQKIYWSRSFTHWFCRDQRSVDALIGFIPTSAANLLVERTATLL